MQRRPPSSTRTDTLFPSTSLFRSHRNLAFGVIRLRPCAQDKNVIDGGTGDFVNTLRLKRVSLFDIAGQMPGRTSGRVSAWHRKASALLALEDCIAIAPVRSVRGDRKSVVQGKSV